MRIAVMADIHGNLAAFEAALNHCRSMAPDVVVIAGDVVNGAPDSDACWKLAKSLGVPIIRGNHERYVAFYGTDNAPAEWKSERFGPVRWTASTMTDEERKEMAELPLNWSIEALPEIWICHSTARSDSDCVAAYTGDADLNAMYHGVSAQLIVRGHNHAPAIRAWNQRSIVTTGSVGLTLDGEPTAQYVLLTRDTSGWRIEHQSVEYDIGSTLERFNETGYLAQAGPMARLFYREVATASFHIVPFMRCYHRWINEEQVTLESAVNRFLGCSELS